MSDSNSKGEKNDQLHPEDENDLRKGGAHMVPKKVTEARNQGKIATFYKVGDVPSRWYWTITGSDEHIMHD